jgi:predicted nucleic acid-binding protein
MIVLDASAVLELLLNTRAGQVVRRRIAPPQISLHAPHLVDLEVTQALRRYVRAGHLSAVRALQALRDHLQLDLARYPHEPLLSRVWALRQNLTAYDAAYVALAEALRAPLLTLDASLAAAPGIKARVEIVR